MEHACDCHMHVYDGRSRQWPAPEQHRPDSTVAEYRLVQKRLGISRTVVVTPSVHGTDNGSTLGALAELGAAARGVAVIDPDISGAELNRLAALGVCGIRVNFVSPQQWGATTPQRLELLARKVAALGWHVQVFALADRIVEMERVLASLPAALVIDHMGRIPLPAGIAHPAFGAIERLLEKGKTWIKLSGAYMMQGRPGYEETIPVAQALVRAAPERMLWGSDWPHPTEKERKPDDAVLFDLLGEWAMNEPTRRRILVDNPRQLYGFPA
jgi:predicted TIM-barrel fold metal-dependent hydrolase